MLIPRSCEHFTRTVISSGEIVGRCLFSGFFGGCDGDTMNFNNDPEDEATVNIVNSLNIPDICRKKLSTFPEMDTI